MKQGALIFDERTDREEAAAIVQKIFSLCVDGLGPTQIAKWLQHNNVLNPTAYAHEKGLPVCNAPTANPYKWTNETVSRILERIEYLGHTVNFKTSKPSFKSKKKVWNNPSEWVIFLVWIKKMQGQKCRHVTLLVFFCHLPKLCAKYRMLPPHSLNSTDSSGFC